MKLYSDRTGYRAHLAYADERPLCVAFDEARLGRASSGEETIICGGFMMKNWRLVESERLSDSGLCKRCQRLSGAFRLDPDGLYYSTTNSESVFWELRASYVASSGGFGVSTRK